MPVDAVAVDEAVHLPAEPHPHRLHGQGDGGGGDRLGEDRFVREHQRHRDRHREIAGDEHGGETAGERGATDREVYAPESLAQYDGEDRDGIEGLRREVEQRCEHPRHVRDRQGDVRGRHQALPSASHPVPDRSPAGA